MGIYFLLLCLWIFPRDFCEGCETREMLINGRCELCPISCSSCTSNPPCTTCNLGYYGEYCLFSCSENCYNNECSKTSGQCLSCKMGYFMDEGKLCSKCPENCITCNSETSCFACSNGFKGEHCQSVCSNCKPGTSCDKNTGYCINECYEGLSGELCDTLCDSKCKLCDRYNKHECISCASNRHGPSCNGQCSSACLLNECDVRDGNCTNGCMDGFWGEKCDNACPEHCRKKACDRSNGNCTTISKNVNTRIDTNKRNAFESHAPIGEILFSVTVVGGIFVVVLSFTVCRKRCREYCGQHFPCLLKKKHHHARNETALEQIHTMPLLDKGREHDTDVEKEEQVARQTENNIDASLVGFEGSIIQVKQEDNSYMDIGKTSITVPDIHHSVVDTVYKNHTFSLAEPSTKEEQHNNTSPLSKIPGQNNDAFTNAKMTSLPPKINCTVNSSTPFEMTVISKITDSIILHTTDVTSPPTGISTTIENQPVRSNGGCGNNNSSLDETVEIPDDMGLKSTWIPLNTLADYVARKRSSSYISEFKKLVNSVYCGHSELSSPKKKTRQVVLENERGHIINAYFIDGYKIADAYIAYMGSTRTLLRSDKNLFWKTVLQERCDIIVMLTIQDTPEEKCTCMNKSLPCRAQYKDVTVVCNGEIDHDSFTIRKYTIEKQMVTINVQRLKFANWPLYGMPNDVTSMVDFVKYANKLTKHLDGPTMVYNSSGEERTGLYIALDTLTKKCEYEECVDIYGCVRTLRELKLNMIPNCDQYEFLHKALVCYLTPKDSDTNEADSTNDC